MLPGVAAVGRSPDGVVEGSVKISGMARVGRDGGNCGWPRVERVGLTSPKAIQIGPARMFLKDVDGQVKRGCRASDVVISIMIDGETGERFLVVAAESDQLH